MGVSILMKHYRLTLFLSSPHDINDGPLSETDNRETNVLSDQVSQFCYTAVWPDCLAWTHEGLGY